MPTPFRKKIIIWNSRFGPVLMPFLVELWRGVERAGEALLLCTCTHALVLGSKRPTLNAYSSQILLAQCREIVDTTNAMNGSVGARWMNMSVCSGGSDVVAHTPPLMPKLGRGRRYVLGCRSMQKISRCCCCSRRTGFESHARKGYPGV